MVIPLVADLQNPCITNDQATRNRSAGINLVAQQVYNGCNKKYISPDLNKTGEFAVTYTPITYWAILTTNLFLLYNAWNQKRTR